jgi:hypothetical protein
MTISPPLATVLSPAYRCPEFDRACDQMRWEPGVGHVPRGFYGATGEISEVELVLVVAEPGDPHPGEVHTGLRSAYEYKGKILREPRDLIHYNLRYIFDLCWPGETIDRQMRKVWVTQSVLCSARKPGDNIPRQSSFKCGQRYLLPQLVLFPSALIVACGNKARDRLNALRVPEFLHVRAIGAPEGNKPGARESWKRIPDALTGRGS